MPANSTTNFDIRGAELSPRNSTTYFDIRGAELSPRNSTTYFDERIGVLAVHPKLQRAKNNNRNRRFNLPGNIGPLNPPDKIP